MVLRPVLLVLHGGAGYDHTTLRSYFDRFADTRQVVYLDHRGCGRSSGDSTTWTLDQWADDIAAFCAVLGIEKPVVFGQSFGGMVAMHYAARHPEGPSRVIPSSTAAQFRPDAAVDMMRRLAGDAAAEASRAFFSVPSLERYQVCGEMCLPYYTRSYDLDAPTFRGRAIARPEVAVHFFINEMIKRDMRGALAQNLPDLGDGRHAGPGDAAGLFATDRAGSGAECAAGDVRGLRVRGASGRSGGGGTGHAGVFGVREGEVR